MTAHALSNAQRKTLVDSIFNHANEGIIVTDKQGQIILVNPAAEAQFGYSAAELQGESVEVLVPREYRKKHSHDRKGYAGAPTARKMGVGRDLNGVKKNGEVFPVEVSLTPFKSSDHTWIIAFIIDISVRKRIEKDILEQRQALEDASRQLRTSNELLEKKVYDRTQVLREALAALEKSKAELSHSLEKEKELNEMKSRFISMASHEFRTPLTAILSSAGLITEYPETDQQDKREKHVHRIQAAVTNLNGILGDFLSLSRIEEGKIGVSYSTFSFDQLKEDVCNELRAIARPGQVLECYMDGKDTLHLDRKLLRQIMVNLLSNAIKYSPDNSKITLSAKHGDQLLDIEVRDEGIGISTEDQKNLFERFFRGENATNIQGTGLGLNIVGSYVELLDGIITFESELDKGSVFRVRLPERSAQG